MFSPKFRLRGGKTLSETLLDSLGELEARVMVEVRRIGEANVNHVNAALGEIYAYTTVMTTLDRLFKKGLLKRRKEGRAFLYSPSYSIEELERGVTRDILTSLFEATTGKAEPVLACIVDSVSEKDLQLLDELERLVQEKRIEISMKGLS